MAQITKMPWFDLFHLAYDKLELRQPVEYCHAHDGIEFLYIHEGTGELVLNERLYRLEPPMLIFYQPFQLHFLRTNTPYSRSLLKVKLTNDERFFQLFPMLQQFLNMLVQQQWDTQVFLLDEQQDADLNYFFRMFSETVRITGMSERREYFYSFWSQFLTFFKTRIFPQMQPAEENTLHRTTQHVEMVMKWVEAHFSEEFHLNQLAEEVHLSPSYVSRLFRKYTGTTLMEYIANRRLKEACLLLRTSSLPISQVARLAGFADAAYFCRSFKKRYGATPLQYRTSSG